MKCGGSTMKKMETGGSTTNKLNKPKPLAKPQMGGSNTKMGIYGIPNAGRTDQLGFKKGGVVKKMAKGGSLKPVPADKVGLAKLPTTVRNKMGFQKKGGSVNKYQNGGSTKTISKPISKPVAKPKPKYVYGEVPGIGGPAAGQAATPGETILMDQKLAAERKAKAAAAKRKAQATKKGK